MRNRIISGLSLGVVVVEAPSRSGALITAFHAADNNRCVYSVPGSIFSAKSAGTLKLVRSGAVPVTCAEEIIEDIMPMLNGNLAIQTKKKFEKEKVSCNARKILETLSCAPLNIDMISLKTKIHVTVLSRELTLLEMMGRVKQTDGKRYIKS